MDTKPERSEQNSAPEEFSEPFEGLTLAELEKADNPAIKRAAERLKRSEIDQRSRSQHRQHSSHRKSGIF